jgi:hypothetical protein
VTEKKKPGKARFTTAPETLGGTDTEGSPDENVGVKTGNSYIYRTQGNKSNTMRSTMPDAKAEEYASELQRETRGMKKGGKVKSASSRADGIAQRGKTRGAMK